jgi:predicted flap endonuclease-1-like 5' DNA nuclease
MSVWIAKLSGLLVAATLIGIAVDRWWVRRPRQKVKFDYARLLQVGIKPRESVGPHLGSPGDPLSLVSFLPEQLPGTHETAGAPDVRIPAMPSREPLSRRHPLLGSSSAPVVGMEPASRDDLAHLHRRLDELVEAVSALHILSPPPPAPPPVDLRPLLERIDSLERTVRLLHATPGPGYSEPSESAPRVVPVSVEVTRVRRGNDADPAPTGATPDDLKRIKGVKGGMERMLRGIGVDYFWQIAAWSPEEVRQAESRLGQFRGRIERDEWVAQAARLMREPDAAPRPDRFSE